MQEPFPTPATFPFATFATFDDFYPYYLTQHRNPINRAAHYVGTTAVLGAVATAAATLVSGRMSRKDRPRPIDGRVAADPPRSPTAPA